MISNFRSEFTAFYLDDGTLGSSLEDIKTDQAYTEDVVNSDKDLNLFLNCSKLKIICINNSTCSSMLHVCTSPHPFRSLIYLMPPSWALLLAVLLPSKQCYSPKSTMYLKFLSTRLKLLHTHNALSRSTKECLQLAQSSLHLTHFSLLQV